MSRGLLVLGIVLLLILSGLIALGLRGGERPLVPVEKAVSLADLNK